MEFFLGALTAVVFFLLLIFAYWIGTKQTIKAQPPPPMDSEHKKELERYNKHFKALFNYDVEKALQRKKVT
jgi:hypothetical protein